MALFKTFMTLTVLTKATIQRDVPLMLFFLIVSSMVTGCGGGGSNGGNNNGVDTTPPNLSIGAPSGVLSSGTTSALLSITTDTDATCKYAAVSGVDYSTMVNTFSTSGGSTHSTDISGFTDGQTYNYYIRCQDGTGNANTNDYLIAFSVARVGDAYYVSPTGSAAWTQCTNIATPCAPATTMSNALAGDTVYFRGGTYELYYDMSKDPSYYWGKGILGPLNSGISSNPITFIAYPGETPLMNCHTDTVRTDNCMAFGNSAENGFMDYIVWDGFTVQADDGVTMGGVALKGYDDGRSRAVGNVIKNCIINGGATVLTSTDNREGMRIDYTSGTLIQNNTLYNFRQMDDWHNTAGIKTYHNDHLIIENNEIYNASAAIFLKSDTDDSIVRNNYIHDAYLGLRATAFAWTDFRSDSDNNSIYNNVFSNMSYIALSLYGQEGAHFDNTEIYNNTIYCANTNNGLSPSEGQNYKIWNNIVQACPDGQYTTGYANITLAESDHNNFGSDSLRILMRLYQADQSIYTTLGDWQNSGELVDGSNPGVGSLASDPLFVNTSGNMEQLTDFALATDSPSKGTGRGGADMGANICAVGVDDAC